MLLHVLGDYLFLWLSNIILHFPISFAIIRIELLLIQGILENKVAMDILL